MAGISLMRPGRGAGAPTAKALWAAAISRPFPAEAARSAGSVAGRSWGDARVADRRAMVVRGRVPALPQAWRGMAYIKEKRAKPEQKELPPGEEPPTPKKRKNHAFFISWYLPSADCQCEFAVTTGTTLGQRRCKLGPVP